MSVGLRAQLDRALRTRERLIRESLTRTLSGAGIDPDGEVGQIVMNDFRPIWESDTDVDLGEVYGIDSVAEWLAETRL